jgi:hypothetical protein
MARTLSDIRIRNLDPDVSAALDGLAAGEGRTVEAYLRELIKDAVRTRIRDFPTASEWVRAGFGEVHETVPGRQYLAWANMRQFRISLTRSLTGEDPQWNSEIEEAHEIEIADHRLPVWARAIDVAPRLAGETAAMALRDAIRWIADFAKVDAVARAREAAEGVRDVSPAFGAIVDTLDLHIRARKTYPRDKMVIYHTADFDIYINEVDRKQGALMVYRRGENWSITDGKADYFALDKTGANTILERLYDLGVLRLAQLEQS